MPLAEGANQGGEIGLATLIGDEHYLERLMGERDEGVAIEQSSLARAQNLPIKRCDLPGSLSVNRLKVFLSGIQILTSPRDIRILRPEENWQVESNLEIPVFRMVRRRREAGDQPVVKSKGHGVIGGVFETRESKSGILIFLGQRGL